MSSIQRFFLAILPKKWGESMRSESEQWQIRCCTCGAARSIWDAGGIRWKAASKGKRIMIRCGHCGTLRAASVEKSLPATPP